MIKFYWFSIIFCCLSSVISYQQSSVPFLEVSALHSLFSSANGEQWSWALPYDEYGVPWNFSGSSVDPCTWQGVECSSINATINTITSVSLFAMGLYGTIPPEFFNLSNLELIDLSGNSIYSTIPAQMYDLPYLYYIDLEYNMLSGTISPSLIQLSNLQIFAVNDNHLSGTIPQQLGECTSITYLDFSSNRFNGSILSILPYLTSLNSFDVSYNLFEGTLPSGFSGMTVFYFLSLRANLFDGSLPPEIGTFPNLYYFYLDVNYFSKSIPSSIGNLIFLNTLFMDTNLLSGEIPTEIGNLIGLSHLSLSSNALSSTIPTSIKELKGLTNLYLQSCHLTGIIPMELGYLPSLYFLDLFDNQLVGTIPSSIGNLTSISRLYLGDNLLVGTIPSEIKYLTGMTVFNTYANHIDGTIPSVVENMTSLIYLELGLNYLTGTLPNLEKLINLQIFDVSSCHLHGTIPKSITQLKKLAFLMLNDNDFEGEIPQSIWTFEPLVFLRLDNNRLHGSISTAVVKLASLHWLSLRSNYFSGTMPSELGSMVRTQALDFTDNLFQGTIPSSLGHLNFTFYLSLANNHITGTIPDSIGNLTLLQTLDLSGNQLQGNPAIALRNLNALLSLNLAKNAFYGNIVEFFHQQLFSVSSVILASNKFTGSISTLFNTYSKVKYFDVSDNFISGSLPDLSLANPDFVAFAAAVNKIVGTIPQDYCNLKALSVLILDGLRTNDNDASELTQSDSNTHGTIPHCLFSLPALSILHLAGNRFKGSLQNEITSISYMFRELSLSHNELSGTIPSWIWKHAWTNLDLSFNRFSGYIPDSVNFTVHPESLSLSLELNHLSGNIPMALKYVSSINILNGNIFECDLQGSQLPVNDPMLHSYVCGSDNVNGGFAAWAFCLGCIVLLGLVGGCRQQQGGWLNIRKVAAEVAAFVRRLVMPIHSELSETNRHIKYFELYTNRMVWTIVMPILFVSVLVYLPLYGILTAFFGVYTSQYLWTVSSCYLTGLTPSVVILSVSIATLYPLMQRISSLSVTVTATQFFEEVKATSKTKTLLVWIVQYTSLFVILATVILANVGYVYALTKNIDVDGMTIITIALSLFKVASGWFVVHGLPQMGSLLLRLYDQTFHGHQEDNSEFMVNHADAVVFGATITTMLMVVNNVAVPYFAEMLVNPNCFFYAITSPPNVVESYKLNAVIEIPLQWYDEVRYIVSPAAIQTNTFQAPFSYSYLCSSNLISSFSYVFMLRYIISSVVMPIVFLSLERLCAYAYAHRDRDENSKSWSKFWLKVILVVTPFRFRPIQWYIDTYQLVDQDPESAISSAASSRRNTAENTTNSDTGHAPVMNPLISSSRSSSMTNTSIDISKKPLDTSINNSNPGKRDSSTTSRVSQSVSRIARSIRRMSMAVLSRRQRQRQEKLVFVLHVMTPSRKEMVVNFISNIAVMLTYGVQFPLLNIVIAASCLVEIRLWYLVYFRRVHILSQRFPLLFAGSVQTLSKSLLQFESSMQKCLVPLPYLAAFFLSYTLFDTLGSSVGVKSAIWILFVMSLAPIYCICIEFGLRKIFASYGNNRFSASNHAASAESASNTKDESKDVELTEMT